MLFTYLQVICVLSMPAKAAFYKCSSTGSVVGIVVDDIDIRKVQSYEVLFTQCAGNKGPMLYYIEPKHIRGGACPTEDKEKK